MVMKILEKMIAHLCQYFSLINPFIIINSKTSGTNITKGYSIGAGFNVAPKYLLLEQLVDILKL